MLNSPAHLLRASLLREYYRHSVLGWFQPKSMHWAKIVTQEGYWKWIRADRGMRGRIVKFPPLHIYQTLLKFQSKGPPRGNSTEGFLLGGPYVFEMDLLDVGQPLSIWKLIDACNIIDETAEVISDYMDGQIQRVMFSGHRGFHLVFFPQAENDSPIKLNGTKHSVLKSFIRERRLTARSMGYWLDGLDWEVSTDIWRVVRVPWSIHGSSALRAIPMKPPLTSRRIAQQLGQASPFTSNRQLRVRFKRNVQLFTFVDGDTYGPFRRNWATKLPLPVALHLIWLDLARPREKGPASVTSWFNEGFRAFLKGAT